MRKKVYVIFSLLATRHSLLFDFITAGFVFSIVGGGIMLSFILILPKEVERKEVLLLAGAISGFLAGLFFHFGIGLYAGIVILSVFIGCALRILNLTTSAGRIILGGVLGGFGGVGFSAVSFVLEKSNGSILSPILSTALITYCINLGMIAFYKTADKYA